MMVYKYWDSITKEDLEFSVGSKAAVWEVKDPLLATPSAAPTYGHMGPGGNGGGYGGRMETDGFGDEGDSNYHTPGSGSLVGGVSGGQYYSHGYPPQGGGGYN
jgi:hypothetical protein